VATQLNPYETPLAPSKDLLPEITAPPRPRVWSVFVVYVLAFVGALAVPVVAVLAVLFWKVSQGGNLQQVAQELPKSLSGPLVFIALGSLSQAVLLLAAMIPALLSTVPVQQRLAISSPSLAWRSYPVVALGALFPLAIGISLAYLIATVIPPDPSVKMLYEQMTWPVAVPFVLFIALAPAITEELLFRGYIQSRLLKRWSPGTAIFVTSTLFAIMHITPHSVVNAFVIGLWLGVLAWRTGSVWPSVVCHAFINGAWNVWNVGRRLDVFPDTPPLPLGIAGGVLIVACFAASAWLVFQPREEPLAAKSPR